MENVLKSIKLGILLLVFVNLSCSNNSNEGNQPPSKFTVQIDEISTNSAKLSWSASTDPEGSTVFYDVFLESEKLIDNTRNLTLDLLNLEEGMIYNGEIIASDPEEATRAVPFTFETSFNQPPTAFNVTVTTRTPMFLRIDWTASSDPEEGEIIYNVYLEDELLEENLRSQYCFIQNLKGKTRYSGYVEAVDPEGKITTDNFTFITEEKVYETDLRLENQNEVDEFGLLGYNKIEGNLIIGNVQSLLTNVSNLQALASLEWVDGNIYIQNTICKDLVGLQNIKGLNSYGNLNIQSNDELLSLEGLEGITSAYEIMVTDNKNLISLNGLKNLSKVTNAFYILYNRSLNSITALRKLTTIEELEITNNDELKNLYGLEGITRLRAFSINDNDNLISFEGLSGLENCVSFSMGENSSLKNMNGLTALVRINYLYVSGNNSLVNFAGLEKLNVINSSVAIQFNNNLESLEGLNNIKFSEGNGYGYKLGIVGNDKLTNLNALSGVHFVDGNLTIQSNSELIDFCGVSNMIKEANSIDIRWNNYNPTLNDILNGKCAL